MKRTIVKYQEIKNTIFESNGFKINHSWAKQLSADFDSEPDSEAQNKVQNEIAIEAEAETETETEIQVKAIQLFLDELQPESELIVSQPIPVTFEDPALLAAHTHPNHLPHVSSSRLAYLPSHSISKSFECISIASKSSTPNYSNNGFKIDHSWVKQISAEFDSNPDSETQTKVQNEIAIEVETETEVKVVQPFLDELQPTPEIFKEELIQFEPTKIDSKTGSKTGSKTDVNKSSPNILHNIKTGTNKINLTKIDIASAEHNLGLASTGLNLAENSTRVVSNPVLSLSLINKSFFNRSEEAHVLKNISLDIQSGEWVAIMGKSGSGKTTLMNLLGCLDTPTTGSFQINGVEASSFTPSELANLRSQRLGFIFQRYHLIEHLSAKDNVFIPASYRGIYRRDSEARVDALFSLLGLDGKQSNKPGQLSGGQQQRVSIARALVNQPSIILADEPTGALDHESSEEVLNALHQLHRNGQTIIMITHDQNVANNAQRIIRLDQGEIASDVKNNIHSRGNFSQGENFLKMTRLEKRKKRPLRDMLHDVSCAIFSKPLRSLLAMAGIVIGIGAAVLIQSIGQSSKAVVIKDINELSGNLIYVYTKYDRTGTALGKELMERDLIQLSKLPGVENITPLTSRSYKYEGPDKTGSITLHGTSEAFMRVRNYNLISGSYIDKDDIDTHQAKVVIDLKTQKALFKNELPEASLGKLITINKRAVQVVGVIESKPGLFSAEDKSLNAWTSYSSFNSRWKGNDNKFDQLILRVDPKYNNQDVESNIREMLNGGDDNPAFEAYNADGVVKTANKVADSITLMLLLISSISLLVGGIGVMNVMLMAVSERTAEIGIRMAVGANKVNIISQFLYESIFLCAASGVIGCIFAIMGTSFIGYFVPQINISVSFSMLAISLCVSTSMGIFFGILPAFRAANLKPADALRSD